MGSEILCHYNFSSILRQNMHSPLISVCWKLVHLVFPLCIEIKFVLPDWKYLLVRNMNLVNPFENEETVSPYR